MTMDFLIHCAGAFGGTLGYTYLLHTPKRAILPSSLLGLMGYAIYLLLYRYLGQGMIFSYFAATAALAAACEIAARVMRMPSTVFLLCALVPLVPGYDFYCAMLALVENDAAGRAAYGLRAVQIVAAIAVGAAVSGVAFRTLSTVRQRGNAQ